ncbi:MAG: (2Fe-2S)-binding protein [Treponema sp.]|nr:(2Fe-2S)-binding protein [Treponema sp.]
MVQIKVHHIDGRISRISVSPAVSLLNSLLSAGIAMHHRCGGKAQCGTCRIRISATSKDSTVTNSISAKEAERLTAIGADPAAGDRLACQTYVFADTDVYLFD